MRRKINVTPGPKGAIQRINLFNISSKNKRLKVF